jgi:transposase InsO family protein
VEQPTEPIASVDIAGRRSGGEERCRRGLRGLEPKSSVRTIATHETELIDRPDWVSQAEAKAAVFEYIEVFYDRIRRHSSLGNLSPDRFEERYRSAVAIAAG